MINLFSFCDIPWWLTWLLPFLLGLGLGYLLWARYKSMVEDLENQINNLNVRISGLEADLEACKKVRMEAEGDVALLRGQLRECELKLSTATSAKAGSGTPAVAFTSSGGAKARDAWTIAIGTDNLQIIEGIGPKMQEVLNENGINTFAQLATYSPEALRDILNKYGDKYRIIDPNTWPQQAQLANDKAWNDLIELQKSLDTGRSDTATSGETDSKLEKWLIKAGILKKWAQDDLKAVEGIGPKIEELLHDAGIKTWRALAETSVSRLQEILTAAGPRFTLAVPETWPQQAGLAADGKWDELQELQDFLNAGRQR